MTSASPADAPLGPAERGRPEPPGTSYRDPESLRIMRQLRLAGNSAETPDTADSQIYLLN